MKITTIVKILDKLGFEINPATEEKQDAIIAKLQEVANNTDELELKADQINLNTDELENKLDTLEDDKATATKQDEIISAIQNQTSGKITDRFSLNEIYEDGGKTYFCYSDKDADWYIKQIDENDNFWHATKVNNPTYTHYLDARNNLSSLLFAPFYDAF